MNGRGGSTSVVGIMLLHVVLRTYVACERPWRFDRRIGRSCTFGRRFWSVEQEIDCKGPQAEGAMTQARSDDLDIRSVRAQHGISAAALLMIATIACQAMANASHPRDAGSTFVSSEYTRAAFAEMPQGDVRQHPTG